MICRQKDVRMLTYPCTFMSWGVSMGEITQWRGTERYPAWKFLGVENTEAMVRKGRAQAGRALAGGELTEDGRSCGSDPCFVVVAGEGDEPRLQRVPLDATLSERKADVASC